VTGESGPSGPVDPPVVAVREAVGRALAEDILPLGDITAALVPDTATAQAAVVARCPGVVAGRLCALEAFALVDPAVTVQWRLDDGSAVGAGSVVAEVAGPLRSILTAERTALNFLCHLSGVATAARRFVDVVHAANPSTRVLDTRKTTPGLRALEKAAVRAGGAWNHRGNLSEAVLIKDNHMGGLSIVEAVARARRWWPGRMVEVECDRIAQVADAVEAGAAAVLLDNMAPDDVAACVALVRARPAGAGVLVEVSGNVTLDTAPAYASAGADLVSVGAITHSAPVLDLGLDLREG
jgi:nicotinate-nucleotide pyrophosphorylase (carboxylating)